MATGIVTFSDGSTILCSNVPLVNGAATCTAKFTSAGTHAVSASYNGSGNFAPSISQAVNVAITDQTGKTVTAIGGFLGARNNQILSNGFDESRQVDRLIEYNGGSGPGENGGESGFASGALGPRAGAFPSGLGSPGFASPLGAGPNVGDFTRLGLAGRGGAGLARIDQPFAGLSVGTSNDYDPTQQSGAALPLRITGSSDGAMSLGFATSLRDFYRFAANRDANKLGVAEGYGISTKPIVSPFDIWIEAKYAGFRDTSIKTNDLDGHFGLVTVGADYVLNRNLLVGAFVQFDSMQQRSNSQATDVSGHGWMAGPYATVRLSDNVFWQSRAAWGTSSNSVSPFLTYTDSFDSDRWLVSSTLTGRWSFGPWSFKPSASVSYIEDTSQAYHDTYGLPIPSVTSSLGQAKVGPEFSYRFRSANDGFVEPHAGLQLIWNFAGDTTATGLGSLNGDASGPRGVRGRVELGVKMGSPSGVALDLSGSYDGIGSSGFDAVTGRAMLRIPFN